LNYRLIIMWRKHKREKQQNTVRPVAVSSRVSRDISHD